MTGWKGTPGPWTVEPEPHHAGGYRIMGPMGRRGVFFCTIATDLTYEDGQQRLRDAAGMAAVPQLVEALEDAAHVFRHYAELHDRKGTNEGREKARRNMEHAERMEAALRAAKVLP